MTGLFHHFVVLVPYSPLFYNHPNPSGLNNLNWYITIKNDIETEKCSMVR
jgi:hypothetical protein